MPIPLPAKVAVVVLAVSASVGAFPRGGADFRPSEPPARKDPVGEPTCEQLKAMWRFSKRQSRAAEMTNEIPTYRDPFSYNVWEPYFVARSRSAGGLKSPIYGRLVHKAPMLRLQDIPDNSRMYDMLFGDGNKAVVEEQRPRIPFRVLGGGVAANWPPQSGSFQHLKELIRTERAKELQEQRMQEEMAARHAAMKELESSQRGHSNLRDMAYAYMDMDSDELQEDEPMVRGGLLSFPDVLAPAARPDLEEDRYVQDQPYYKDRSKAHTSSLFDSTSYNMDFDGFFF